MTAAAREAGRRRSRRRRPRPEPAGQAPGKAPAPGPVRCPCDRRRNGCRKDTIGDDRGPGAARAGAGAGRRRRDPAAAGGGRHCWPLLLDRRQPARAPVLRENQCWADGGSEERAEFRRIALGDPAGDRTRKPLCFRALMETSSCHGEQAQRARRLLPLGAFFASPCLRGLCGRLVLAMGSDVVLPPAAGSEDRA